MRQLFEGYLIISLFTLTHTVYGKIEILKGPSDFGFTPIFFISPGNFQNYLVEQKNKKQDLENFCDAVKLHYQKINWREDPCNHVPWQMEFKSKNGNPLIYAVFGKGKQTTLVLGGVHPDEYTPVPMAFRFAAFLHQHKRLYEDHDIKIVVAPLVNPDGFIRNVPSRTNANGIDLNRNFLTVDWYDRSQRLWQQRRQRNPSHFPGYFPNSEIETLFQVELIETYRPDKVLSIHAPLGFLDYDGPGDQKPRKLTKSEITAKQLVKKISEKSQNYRVVDYTFYPGSLGNFAGNERNIPTITLELPTTDPQKIDEYWQQFYPGLLHCVQYPYRINGEGNGWKINRLSIQQAQANPKSDSAN